MTDDYEPYSARVSPPSETQFNLTDKFRAQFVHIARDLIGGYEEPAPYTYASPPPSNHLWEALVERIEREHGLLWLHEASNLADAFVSYFLGAANDLALDCVEVALRGGMTLERMIEEKQVSHTKLELAGKRISGSDAVKETNRRFVQNGIGFRFEDGRIVRADSPALHQHAVKPAFTLLHDEAFHGAADEFEKAQVHLRHGRTKEAIREAGNAFESAMRTICDEQGWNYPANPQAKHLIEALFDNHLIPASLQSQFAALRALLESGVPTVRNKMGGHGQGAEPVVVPEPFAAFAVNATATNIVLLVTLHKEHREAASQSL